MPQLRVHVSQPKIQNAATKMGHSQVNKKKIVQRKRRRCGLKAWSLRISPSTFTLPASSPLVMLLINSKLWNKKILSSWLCFAKPSTDVRGGVISLSPRISQSSESACNAGDLGSIPGSGRSLGEGNGNPLQYFLPGELHGQRSLASYSPWGHKELDMTERLTLSHSLSGNAELQDTEQQFLTWTRGSWI